MTLYISLAAVFLAYWGIGIWMLRRPKVAGPETVGASIKRYLLALLWLPVALINLWTGDSEGGAR